jgi:hypothetical protein
LHQNPKSWMFCIFTQKKGKNSSNCQYFVVIPTQKQWGPIRKLCGTSPERFHEFFTKISSNRREEAFNSILGPKWKCLRSSHLYYWYFWAGFNDIDSIYQYFEDMPRQKQWGPIRKLWGTSSLRQNWQRLGRQEDDL